jgi:hypothetical protein
MSPRGQRNADLATAGLPLTLLASAPGCAYTHLLPGGTAFAETLTRAIVAPGSPKHVTATPATS